MLKTTRNKEGKQTEPSKTLVPIIRNRIDVSGSTYWAQIAVFSRHPPNGTEVGINF